jgi:hypothetical protein
LIDNITINKYFFKIGLLLQTQIFIKITNKKQNNNKMENTTTNNYTTLPSQKREDRIHRSEVDYWNNYNNYFNHQEVRNLKIDLANYKEAFEVAEKYLTEKRIKEMKNTFIYIFYDFSKKKFVSNVLSTSMCEAIRVPPSYSYCKKDVLQFITNKINYLQLYIAARENGTPIPLPPTIPYPDPIEPVQDVAPVEQDVAPVEPVVAPAPSPELKCSSTLVKEVFKISETKKQEYRTYGEALAAIDKLAAGEYQIQKFFVKA